MRAGTNLKGAGIRKAPTGIAGLDEITHGGLPYGQATLVMGQAGAGKTVLALKSLVFAAREEKEPGIFVAFEEDTRKILANAAGFGWKLEELVRSKRLRLMDAQLHPDTVQAGNFDLNGLLSVLDLKVKELGAKRIVFDGIDVLLEMLTDPLGARRELDRLQRWLAKKGLTGIITVKSGTDPLAPEARYEFVQYMVECVVQLRHRLVGHTLFRTIRVTKYRGSRFSENEFSMNLGESGIEVTGLGNDLAVRPASTKRVSSGVARLDSMLSGGYFRGSTILISGSPGTAKSTLSAAFARAACKQGMPVLYVNTEESASELIRNQLSVNLDLRPFVRSGKFKVCPLRPSAKSVDEHFLDVRDLLQTHRPGALIIDPISALSKTGNPDHAIEGVQWLLRQTKAAGITTVLTSLLGTADARTEEAALPISTLADCWIHLSYVVQKGERNRALTIVKARGTWHSNQVRELVLSDKGVTLTDVYLMEGEVLMGAARHEKEADLACEAQMSRSEFDKKNLALKLAEAEIKTRIQLLELELRSRRMEFDSLAKDSDQRQKKRNRYLAELKVLRGGD